MPPLNTDVPSDTVEHYVKLVPLLSSYKVEATKKGDEDSKKVISELAPQMADSLKKEKFLPWP